MNYIFLVVLIIIILGVTYKYSDGDKTTMFSITTCLVLFLIIYHFCPSCMNLLTELDETRYNSAYRYGEPFTAGDLHVPAEVGMDNTFDPQQFQPDMMAQINLDGLMGIPTNVIPPWSTDVVDPSNRKDGSLEIESIGYSMCSPSCCTPQYPVPFPNPTDPLVCQSKEELVPTALTCNNGFQRTGCYCMSKQQNDFLSSRGNNA